jgi:hypothetical protein
MWSFCRSVRLTFALFLVGLCGLACGGSNGPTNPPDPEPSITQGWSEFEQDRAAAAAGQFRAALRVAPGNAEARNGLAWSCLMLDSLATAAGHFRVAAAGALAEPAEASAGWALCLRDTHPTDWPQAIGLARTALTFSPQFTFRHKTSVDWRDLRLLLAEGAFVTGAYADCNREITALGGRPQDPQSPTFLEDLLEELRRLAATT